MFMTFNFGYTPTEVIIVDILFYIIILILVYACVSIDNKQRYRTNKVVGDKGESIVKNKLDLLDDDYVVENNVKINGYQIDHLVINHVSMDIFVIETKMWGGIISGDVNDEYWMQNKNGNVKALYNPILQNRKHCNAVRKHYHGYTIHNVIVFIKNRNVPKSRCIFGVNELIDYIYKVCNRVCNRHRIDL